MSQVSQERVLRQPQAPRIRVPQEADHGYPTWTPSPKQELDILRALRDWLRQRLSR